MEKQLPTIVECKIGPYPRKLPEGMFDPMPKVSVKLSNDMSQELYEFYPDEISFTKQEFIGLTIEEAIHLKYTKDLNYIKN